MLLGGLRAAEVRSLRLAVVDIGRHGTLCPVDGAFSAKLAAYCGRSARLATGHRNASWSYAAALPGRR